MQKTNKKKIVFILGMHRSGTSVTAELVHSMGFTVPGTPLDAIDSVNAHGFWESKEVFDINEKVLAAAGLRWFHICPVGHIFKNLVGAENFSAEISDFLKSESDMHGDLIIKDPRLCLLWPLWFSAIDKNLFDVRIIFVNRHPSSIAASIRKRDGFSFFSSHLLWLYYFFSVFGNDSIDKALVLNYESLLNDVDCGEKIARFIGSDRVSEECWSRVVEPLLQRNFDLGFPSNSVIFDVESRVYEALSHGSVYDDFNFLSDENILFESFIFNSSDLVFALNESNNCIVESRSDLVFIGSMHSEALNVIKEKDFSIFESSAYIENCHSRIAELDFQIIELNGLLGRVNDLEKENHFLLSGIKRNSDYIAECEGRIFDLEFSMSDFLALRDRIGYLEFALTEFEALRARLSEVEAALHQKEDDVSSNIEYIAKCHARIAELDDLFLQQRNSYLSCLDAVKQLEKKLSHRNGEFFSIMDEFSVLKIRLDGLLSLRTVRMLERYSSKRRSRSD